MGQAACDDDGSGSDDNGDLKLLDPEALAGPILMGLVEDLEARL